MQNVNELLTPGECELVEKVALRHPYISWQDPDSKKPLELDIIYRQKGNGKFRISSHVKMNISFYI